MGTDPSPRHCVGERPMHTSTTTDQPARRGKIPFAAPPPRPAMRTRRLLQLIACVQSERFRTRRELAELCEVSRRTIYRDLETWKCRI